jgi:spoIIIJ-associated protein
MKSVETEGKTIEEAIAKACEKLDASREDLEIDILANGSAGFLGLVGGKKAQIRATLKKAPSAPPERGVEEGSSTTHLPGDFTAKHGKKTLEDLLRLLELETSIDLQEESEHILLNIKGDGSGLLIGRKGQTLDALEYLVNKIVQRDAPGGKRIIVDTENYRSRREESLIHLAQRLGERAKKLGRPVTISPMSAHDRRIIHLALQNDQTLRTRSTGGGLYRRLVITPEKKSS